MSREISGIVESLLDRHQRVDFLLDVGRATLPALGNLPETVGVINDAFALAHDWNSLPRVSANDLYAFANHEGETGLAFEEAKATTEAEVSAIVTCVLAYYYAVWCAFVEEGAKFMPEDVEGVRYEVFPAIFQFAVASGVVSEHTCNQLLGRYLGDPLRV